MDVADLENLDACDYLHSVKYEHQCEHVRTVHHKICWGLNTIKILIRFGLKGIYH